MSSSSDTECESSSLGESDEITQEKIEDIKKRILQSVQLPCISTISSLTTRNVLMFGRGRSGKTTLVNVLKDHTYRLDISEIRRSKPYHKFLIQERSEVFKERQNYTINMMDCGGFQAYVDTTVESNSLKKDSSTMRNFIRLIEKFIQRNRWRRIHCVLYLLNAKVGLDRRDLEYLQILKEIFGGCGVKLAMVFTRCETKNTRFKNGITDQLILREGVREYISEKTYNLFCDPMEGCRTIMKVLKTKLLSSKMEEETEGEEEEEDVILLRGGGEVQLQDEEASFELDDDKFQIFFMGAVQPRHYLSEKLLNQTYKRVEAMRKMLLHFIFSSWEGSDVDELGIIKRYLKGLEERVMSDPGHTNDVKEKNEFFRKSLEVSRKVQVFEINIVREQGGRKEKIRWYKSLF